MNSDDTGERRVVLTWVTSILPPTPLTLDFRCCPLVLLVTSAESWWVKSAEAPNLRILLQNTFSPKAGGLWTFLGSPSSKAPAFLFLRSFFQMSTWTRCTYFHPPSGRWPHFSCLTFFLLKLVQCTFFFFFAAESGKSLFFYRSFYILSTVHILNKLLVLAPQENVVMPS